jgi:hypothetical protein
LQGTPGKSTENQHFVGTFSNNPNRNPNLFFNPNSSFCTMIPFLRHTSLSVLYIVLSMFRARFQREKFESAANFPPAYPSFISSPALFYKASAKWKNGLRALFISTSEIIISCFNQKENVDINILLLQDD